MRTAVILIASTLGAGLAACAQLQPAIAQAIGALLGS